MSGYNRSKGKNIPKYLQETEVKQILERAEQSKKRDHLILLTLFRTGLRVSELVNLEKRDIRQQEGEIIVRQGKGNKDRIVPLEKELGHLLGYYMDDLTMQDRVFNLSKRTIRNIVKKHIEGLDLSLPTADISPHTFRHSYAVKVLKDGVNLRSLQKALGHSDLSTTERYLDIVADDVKEDFKAAEW